MGRIRTQPWRGAFAKLMLAVLLVGVPAAAATGFVRRASERRSADPSAPVLATLVEPGTFSETDPRPTTLVVTWQRGYRSMYVGEAGTVTAVHVAARDTPASGAALVTVDDRIVFALRSAIPLFRDLKAGDEGTDVAELEKFLATFGLVDVRGRSKIDRKMNEAIRTFNVLTGRRDLGSTFTHLAVAWIGSTDETTMTAIDEVLVHLGDNLAGPTALYETSPTVVDAVAVFDIADRPGIQGPRLAEPDASTARPFRLAADTYSVDVSQWAELAEIVTQPEFGTENRTITKVAGSTRLAEPVTFQVVPVEAVITSRSGTTCVYSATDKPTVIEVAGSEPGIVLVSADQPLPASLVVLGDEAASLSMTGQDECAG
jgi:hypothetical protein